MDSSKRPTSSVAGELAAIRFGNTNVEMLMASILLSAPPEDRAEIVRCFLKKLKALMRELKTCIKQTDDTGNRPTPVPGQVPGPKPPKCAPDEILVDGFCVPREGG